MTRYLLNIKTGEVCDQNYVSGCAFVDKAGTWQNVVYISEEAYNKIKHKEE